MTWPLGFWFWGPGRGHPFLFLMLHLDRGITCPCLDFLYTDVLITKWMILNWPQVWMWVYWSSWLSPDKVNLQGLMLISGTCICPYLYIDTELAISERWGAPVYGPPSTVPASSLLPQTAPAISPCSWHLVKHCRSSQPPWASWGTFPNQSRTAAATLEQLPKLPPCPKHWKCADRWQETKVVNKSYFLKKVKAATDLFCTHR